MQAVRSAKAKVAQMGGEIRGHAVEQAEITKYSLWTLGVGGCAFFWSLNTWFNVDYVVILRILFQQPLELELQSKV